VIFSPTTASGLRCSGQPCVPELFHYEKHNAGVEADFRINPQNRLSGGFDYTKVDRERIDFDENKDHKYFVQLKSSLGIVDARVKYQYLERRSHHTGLSADAIDAFVRRFDLANVDQNLFKVVVDVSPIPLLDLGAEAIYKKNDYKDTVLGRTEDERQEYYLSAAFGDPKAFRVIVFGDVEYSYYDSLHRVGTGNPDPSAPPSGTPFSTTYTWSARNKDRSWQAGAAADWLLMERLSLKASLVWDRTKGTADFAAQAGTALAPGALRPINNFDNTTRRSANLKGTYRFTKNWDFTAGYAYERYSYSDIGFDCPSPAIASQPACPYVVNTIPAGGTSTSYLTGQSAFQDYKVNIVYFVATYRF